MEVGGPARCLTFAPFSLGWGVPAADLHWAYARARQEPRAALLGGMAFRHFGSPAEAEQEAASPPENISLVYVYFFMQLLLKLVPGQILGQPPPNRRDSTMREPHDPDGTFDVPFVPADPLEAGLAAGMVATSRLVRAWTRRSAGAAK